MPTKAVTLYAVEEHLQAMLDSEALIEPDQIELFQQELAAAGEAAVAKRDNVIRFIRHVEAQAEFAQAEEKRLAEWRRSLETGLKRFEGYVVKCIESTGAKRIDGSIGALRIQKNPDTVVIDDINMIPHDLVDVTVTMRRHTWDAVLASSDVHLEVADAEAKLSTRKTEIAKLLKAGEDVPGADLRFGENRLEIK